MIKIPKELVEAYRLKTFRILPSLRLKNQDDAIAFVKERGFIFFWPITNIHFPSLWTATAGNRPVAANHDDPGHITWQWKDKLLGSRVWYYGKILRKKATMISPNIAPYFYALSNNYGAPEEDYITLYEQGRLSQEARIVYEALLKNGALDTIALRKAAHLSSPEMESRFNKALVDLQSDFKIAPVGISRAGGWNYAFIYDITPRVYSNLLNESRFIDEKQARIMLMKLYFTAMGVAKLNDAEKIFQWKQIEIEQTIQLLIRKGVLMPDVTIDNDISSWFGLSSMLE